MDTYEYLFSKLQLKFEEQLLDFNQSRIKQFGLYSDSELIGTFKYYQTVKDLFLFLTDPKHPLSHWMITLRPVIKLLRQFPRDLESKEHVDLLLTVNGMNKEFTI